MPFTVVVAGTTENTVTALSALWRDERFEIAHLITPEPKPIGRKQIITRNPVHEFAIENNIPATLVKQRLTPELAENLLSRHDKPDFLLVVDFGYLIPHTLLNWPAVAPVNIHPSDLPRWRGSSPGQFVLLYDEKESALSIIIMNEELDQGPIITQESFTVDESWTQTEYYRYGFEIAGRLLPDTLAKLADGLIQPTPQPTESPTPTASRLKKADAFIEWTVVSAAMRGDDQRQPPKLSSAVLNAALSHHRSLPILISRATRAFWPWPGLWTVIKTPKGQKRMKILASHVKNNKLVLEKVQIEGQLPALWKQVKNFASN